MNDAPPVPAEALENQGEHASDIPLVASQVPAAQHQRRIRAKQPNLEARKVQLTHRRPVRIILLIASADRLEAPRDATAPGERQLR